MTPLNEAELARALRLRDLTDPDEGLHAMQLLVDALSRALSAAWPRATVRIVRGPRVVDIADNYDRLGYATEAVARDARYTRYVEAGRMLRSHTSAMISPALRALDPTVRDVVLLCPGIVYRRDAIDRLHTGEPHQVDVWRIRRGAPPLTTVDLEEMIATAVRATLPGASLPRTEPRVHPYTLEGRQVDVEWPSLECTRPIEIAECGLAHPEVLARAGLDPAVTSGLAMGMGLDRLLMIRKGVDDIRRLRSTDARVASQMLDLSPYRPVSEQPCVRRDLSVVVAADDVLEDIGDRVRTALGDACSVVEEVTLLSETPYAALPDAARERLGIDADQKNALVRVLLRDLERTLTHEEANLLSNRIFLAIDRAREGASRATRLAR